MDENLIVLTLHTCESQVCYAMLSHMHNIFCLSIAIPTGETPGGKRSAWPGNHADQLSPRYTTAAAVWQHEQKAQPLGVRGCERQGLDRAMEHMGREGPHRRLAARELMASAALKLGLNVPAVASNQQEQWLTLPTLKAAHTAHVVHCMHVLAGD